MATIFQDSHQGKKFFLHYICQYFGVKSYTIGTIGTMFPHHFLFFKMAAMVVMESYFCTKITS